MALEIIADKKLWDGLVDTSPRGMLFHKWDFLRIIEKYTGYRLRPYGIYKDGEPIGLFPVFFKKIGGLKFAYSPPQGTLAYIPYMGPIPTSAFEGLDFREKKTYTALMYREVARELGGYAPDFTSMLLAPPMDDIRPLLAEGYDAEILYTYRFDLRKPIEEVWNGLEGDCRKKLKRCGKYDLAVKRANDVDTLYGIMADCLHGQGRTFFHRQSPDYLKELLEAYPDNLKMSLLYLDKAAVGAHMHCLYKGLGLGWCGGVLVNDRIALNEYFEWETIKLLKAEGYRCYENWGGDMRRLSFFKAKFNPELVPYFHVRKTSVVGRLTEWGHGVVTDFAGRWKPRPAGLDVLP